MFNINIFSSNTTNDVENDNVNNTNNIVDDNCKDNNETNYDYWYYYNYITKYIENIAMDRDEGIFYTGNDIKNKFEMFNHDFSNEIVKIYATSDPATLNMYNGSFFMIDALSKIKY